MAQVPQTTTSKTLSSQDMAEISAMWNKLPTAGKKAAFTRKLNEAGIKVSFAKTKEASEMDQLVGKLKAKLGL